MPAFAGVVVSSLYNIVDRVFIGQSEGVFALAGLSAVFPIMLIQHAFAMLVGIGTGVQISIGLGSTRKVRAQRLLGNGVTLATLLGVFFSIVGYLLRHPLLKLFGIGEAAYGYANGYLVIVLLGSVFHLVGFTLSTTMRAEGHPKHSMYATFISATLNVVLDALFIFGFGWGVKGAAWATVIAQLSQVIYSLRFFTGSKCVVPLKRKYLTVSRPLTGIVLSIGFAPFAMQLAGSLAQGLFNIQLVEYGSDIAVGAMGIMNSISGLLVMTVVSLNMAAQPIYGYNFGAKLYERLKRCLHICLVAATLLATAGFILVQSIPRALILLFDSHTPELVEVGVPAMRIFFALFPFVGIQIVAGNYFQSVGKALTSAMVSLSRRLLFLAPLLLIVPKFYGLNGVWMSGPIADLLAFTVCAIFLLRENRILNQAIAKQKAITESNT